MHDRTVRVTIIMELDEADDRSICGVAEDDFGVERAADTTLPHVLAAIVRNTLEAQFRGFGVPVMVVDATPSETDSVDSEE